ncbi:uncharacterized protein LOC111618879 [Centruroides sculpturatus]|uniref:uncharacterized protein LOC111618879 n=1 Tax=Centruroides sculpturatus TaxID=218467 RepID=UPI000C6E0912|nr:uncharacterized protein LOC111618879 [Centruroides sculpturatus]
MAGVLTEKHYNPLQSFLLSSWNNTIGPQILVRWKPKVVSSNEIVNKIKEENVEVSHKDPTLNKEFKSGIEDSVEKSYINDSNISSLNQKRDLNQLNQLDSIENRQLDILEEIIFLDDQNDNCLCSQDITFKAVGQLLLGELENYPALLGSYSRMYLLSEKNIIIITNLFQLNNCIDLNGKSVDNLRLSLSAIFKYEDKEFILNIYSIIDLMLRRQVSILQAYKVLSLDIINCITMHLNNNYNTISDLYNFSLKHQLSLSETYFEDKSISDLKFFERCLASHFQSCS